MNSKYGGRMSMDDEFSLGCAEFEVMLVSGWKNRRGLDWRPGFGSWWQL